MCRTVWISASSPARANAGGSTSRQADDQVSAPEIDISTSRRVLESCLRDYEAAVLRVNAMSDRVELLIRLRLPFLTSHVAQESNNAASIPLLAHQTRSHRRESRHERDMQTTPSHGVERLLRNVPLNAQTQNPRRT